LFIATLELKKTSLEFGQRLEVVGQEEFALNDREVDLDLVEPAGMNEEYGRGVWTRIRLGHLARRRRCAASARWEEPLSTIQNTQRAER
jgi:hypothetical protein